MKVRKQARTLFLEARCTFHGTLNNHNLQLYNENNSGKDNRVVIIMMILLIIYIRMITATR